MKSSLTIDEAIWAGMLLNLGLHYHQIARHLKCTEAAIWNSRNRVDLPKSFNPADLFQEGVAA